MLLTHTKKSNTDIPVAYNKKVGRTFMSVKNPAKRGVFAA